MLSSCEGPPATSMAAADVDASVGTDPCGEDGATATIEAGSDVVVEGPLALLFNGSKADRSMGVSGRDLHSIAACPAHFTSVQL